MSLPVEILADGTRVYRYDGGYVVMSPAAMAALQRLLDVQIGPCIKVPCFEVVTRTAAEIEEALATWSHASEVYL